MEQHEYTWNVPAVSLTDPPMRIGISAHGGWPPDEPRGVPSGNGLDYAVEVAGQIVYEGGDASSQFHTPAGRAATYLECVATLCGFLSSYADGQLVDQCQYAGQPGMCTCDASAGEADPECTALVSQGETIATGEAARMIAGNGDRFAMAEMYLTEETW